LSARKVTFLIARQQPYSKQPGRLGMQTQQDELMTVSEIAALLKVPVSWVYERTRRRGIERLPHVKLGKYLRFSMPEIKEWLQKQYREM
jgi:excisionase family DNA binding protein